MTNTDSIDAVIAWVDGSDPVHRDRKLAAQQDRKNVPSSTILAGLDETRFCDNGEVEYCVRSIRRFLPWVRNIFLVTDNQRPAFLTSDIQRELGIEIVDHQHIFRQHAWALPTFNSLAIETMLWRIEGLSNRFLYFNDDMILLKPMQAEDFFQHENVVLRGRRERLERYGNERWLLSKTANLIAKKLFNINRSLNALQQMLGARLAGATGDYFRASHVPYPLHVSTLKQFFEQYPGHVADNIAYRFRNRLQYAPTSLANHLEIANGRALLKVDDESIMVCFNRDTPEKIESKLADIETGRAGFFCLQSFEQASESDRERVHRILSEAVLYA